MAKISLKRGPMEPGIYKFVIESVEDREGPSGYPYVRMNLRCVNKGLSSQTVWANLSTSPRARWKMEQFLDAIGAAEEGELDSESLIGKKLLAEVEVDTSSGQRQLNVTNFLVETAGDEYGEEEEELEASNGASTARSLNEIFKEDEIPF